LEFSRPGTLEPIADMVGGGPFRLRPGQWTDDTSMALCLAASLIEKRGFDAEDQMERYCKWRDEGYMSATGECFDIGMTCNGALHKFETTGNPFAGSHDPHTAGNGSLMRLAPVPMAFRPSPELAIHYAAESSRTTHAAHAALDACKFYAALIIGGLEGRSKDELLSRGFFDGLLVREIAEIAEGSFKHKNPPTIVGSGYVVRSLEAALWAFHRSSSFRAGALLAANLGDDADTTAAIFGQLAGAYYTAEGIPAGWLSKLAMREEIERMADQLFAISALKLA
jgi:ADP-ribosylglycohydrolase